MVKVRPRTRLVLAPLTLVLLSACELTSMSPPPPPPGTFAVSGVITAATLTGVVPVGGVVVEESQTGRQVLSEGNGFYTVEGVRSGSVSLKIIKPPFVPLTRPVLVSGNTVFNIQISEKIYSLSGVVTETTALGPIPVADVEVEAEECPYAVDWSSAVAVTDANGLYTLNGLCSGGNAVFITKASYELPKTTPPCENEWGTVCRSVTVAGNTRLDLELVRQ